MEILSSEIGEKAPFWRDHAVVFGIVPRRILLAMHQPFTEFTFL